MNAQVLYGGLVGTVKDSQGAVLPGVAVSITNVGTGLKLDTVTDETGNYVFRNLLPGTVYSSYQNVARPLALAD